MENLGNPVTILQNMDQAVNLAYATSRYFQKTWATLNPWKSELFELSQIFIENIATHNPWKSLLQVNLDMTDHCTTDFCIWRTISLVPVRCISSIRHMYTTDFAYDGPIFLVPLSPSYPSSPVLKSNPNYWEYTVVYFEPG